MPSNGTCANVNVPMNAIKWHLCKCKYANGCHLMAFVQMQVCQWMPFNGTCANVNMPLDTIKRYLRKCKYANGCHQTALLQM